MRKTILFTVMLLAIASSIQADNKLTAKEVKIAKGNVAELIISMENDIEVGGYDFHLYLPKGITLAFDEKEEDYVYELSDRHNKKHQLTIMYDELDESYLFGVADPSLHKLKNNSGEVIRLQLIATSDAIPGTYQGSIKKIWFAESGSSGVDVADTIFIIEVTDTGEGIYGVFADGDNAKYYTLNGLRVVTPMRGIYIKNGKKKVKK